MVIHEHVSLVDTTVVDVPYLHTTSIAEYWTSDVQYSVRWGKRGKRRKIESVAGIVVR
jgi:hypothetical protein